ncbi:MAG: peptide MFS transporter [Brumimicrobium sp.]|nr:peptide MFS transporter [Brumimicrobium sp.]MCO5268072.1 peptide MFS transporter [Brumimicrobium sp.]
MSNISKTLTLEEIHNFKGKYPKQLWYLFLSEMWERFCFYGMRGMLTVFMIDTVYGLSMTEETAQLRYGAIQAFIYAFTFAGGLFADKIIGFRKSLFWGGIMMITGSAILALNPHDYFLIGISFTVIGTGFFKPNISTMVGLLYRDGDNRRDAGFSVFYSGINIGALLGGAICVYVGKHYSWNLAFGFAGIVMTISLLTFLFTQKRMGPIGLSPLLNNVPHEKELDIDGTATAPVEQELVEIKIQKNKRWQEYAVYVGSLLAIPLIYMMVENTRYTDLFMYIVGPLALIYFFFEMTKHSWAEQKKLIAALLFIIFSILFWGIYEQAGGSLSIFALNNLDDDFMGILKMDPNSVNNAANALFVIIFAFVASFVWLALAKRKIEPNTVVKFGLGFLFLGAGFYVFYAMRFFASEAGVSSLNIFILAYLIVTLGELCLSPIGLSIMTKLSPKSMQGMMMGFWFLASAYGQYVAGLFGANLSKGNEGSSNFDKMMNYTAGYKQFAIYALIAGVILILISPWIRKLMQEVK